jgi:hypothetical protein
MMLTKNSQQIRFYKVVVRGTELLSQCRFRNDWTFGPLVKPFSIPQHISHAYLMRRVGIAPLVNLQRVLTAPTKPKDKGVNGASTLMIPFPTKTCLAGWELITW